MATDDARPNGRKARGRRTTNRSSLTVGALTGYLFGVVGFYTNFFETILQATAILLDLGLVVAGWALWHYRHRRPRIRRRGVLAAVGVVALVALANLYWLRPPELVRSTGSESCVYNVLADDGTPVPIAGAGRGSATQTFVPRADEINSVSVIIGIDEVTASVDRPHPISLHIRSADGSVGATLDRPDIVNNAFSRFDFPEPLEVRPDDPLTIQVVNRSTEPVSVYVKRPGATEIVHGAGEGVVIRGQVDREAEHLVKDFALSGCVTRPA